MKAQRRAIGSESADGARRGCGWIRRSSANSMN
jgi:hypothetical protein